MKSMNMKLYSFIFRLQELYAYLGNFLSDIEGQTISPLPEDEIMDIILYSMPISLKNKMIEQGFNYTDSTIKEMTDFYVNRVEIL